MYDFIASNSLMTLATSDLEGKPEAATVEYVVDGDSLLINTFISYRKYKNSIKIIHLPICISYFK